MDTFRNNNITIVKENEFINVILNFIFNNNHNVTNYDDIKEVYCAMILDHYYFIIDRDLISDILVDITFILSPSSINKGRVIETIDMEEDDLDD